MRNSNSKHFPWKLYIFWPLFYTTCLEFFYIFIFELSYYHSSVSRHMCWTISECLFCFNQESVTLSRTLLSFLQARTMVGWGLSNQQPMMGAENIEIASSLVQFPTPALHLTLDPSSLCPARGCKWTIPAAWVCTAASKLHASIQSWVWAIGRIPRSAAPGYTHLLPVTQSPIINLGAAVQGFCRFN